MDKFLNTIIIIFLINIILVYLYQNLISKNEVSNHINSYHEYDDPKLSNNISNLLNNSNEMNQTAVNPINFNLERKLGPVKDFHQSFNDKLNNPKVRELGWRKYYLRNHNKNLVKKDTQFQGITTENYLHNLENNRNVYL